MLLKQHATAGVLWASLVLPLSSPEKWIDLPYSGKPRNEVTHSASGLKVGVKQSSSPLFFPLGETMKLRGVKVRGSLSGLPVLGAGGIEADDYALRLGLVTEGTRKLTWFDRWLAPGWLKRLSELAPENGVGRIVFLKLAQTEDAGTIRLHPKDESLEERVVLRVSKPGPFAFDYTLPEPLQVVAIWIQADGDDTKSSYELSLTSVEVSGD